MRWQRVKTIAWYAYYHATHSMETWVDLVWFPMTNIILFGFFISYFFKVETSQITGILLGLMFWEALRVMQYSIGVGLMWDIWSKNFTTLFVSPLTLREYLTGQAVAGFFKAVVVMAILGGMCWLFFDFSPLLIAAGFPFYMALVALFGLSTALLILAMIFRFGTDVQSLSWSLIYLYQPISAVVYPLEALPPSVRWLSYGSPLTFMMEAVRFELATGRVAWLYLWQSLLVNVIYLVLSILIFRMTVNWAKSSGSFARMEM